MILSKTVVDQIESDICARIDDLLEGKRMGRASGTADSAESPGQSKPFHKALLPRSFIRMSSFERSFSTMLGISYERHSEIIARPRFARVERQHKTEGSMLESVDTEISNEVGRINKGHVFENYFEVVEKIVDMEKRGSGRRVVRTVTSDLYLKGHDGAELFFEIKTPKPNKEQCINITREHLRIHAMLKAAHPRVRTYLGMAYNPYGEGNRYRHSFAVNHLDVERQTVIGKQYWDLLGGEGAYEELLETYRRIGDAKSNDIIRALKT